MHFGVVIAGPWPEGPVHSRIAQNSRYWRAGLFSGLAVRLRCTSQWMIYRAPVQPMSSSCMCQVEDGAVLNVSWSIEHIQQKTTTVSLALTSQLIEIDMLSINSGHLPSVSSPSSRAWAGSALSACGSNRIGASVIVWKVAAQEQEAFLPSTPLNPPLYQPPAYSS